MDCLSLLTASSFPDDFPVRLLIEHGRFAQAEAILFTQLRQRTGRHVAGRKNIPIPDPLRGSLVDYGSDPTQDVLPLLFELYVRAGRPYDALRLLDEAPLWSNTDVAGELSWAQIKSDSGFVVACVRALAAGGRKADALQVLRAGLLGQPSVMPLYELLLTLVSTDQALTFLDELRAGHPLVAQPLIGKALVYQKLGKQGDAEVALRKAIALDPWQADQPRGERRKAHALLADLLEKQGRAVEAMPLHKAVAAIRAEEEIELLRNAGLTQRALRACEAAQTQFPDEVGPNVLRVTLLSEQKRATEAQPALRRALELLATHDWWANSSSDLGLFSEKALYPAVARVLEELLAKSPKKAGLHYLLGSLRRAQGRHREAITAFAKATKLAPDFVLAWRALQDEAERYGGTEGQQATLQILRLAPLGHSMGGEPREGSAVEPSGEGGTV